MLSSWYLTSNDEVDVVPVREKQPLENLNDLLEPALAYRADWLIKALGFELSKEHLCLLYPLRTKSLVLC